MEKSSSKIKQELSNNKDLLEKAKTTFAIEAKAIAELSKQLDSDFLAVIRSIEDCKGRVIVTGIGKSAVIAMKIVATFNSTGTPAVFMHAADAIHGDLGVVLPTDIVLCISKSGTSGEIKDLVPHILNRGNLLIGMTANKSSYLAEASNYILFTPVEKEACPNNLAPTTSTTVQLAMGDALAVCLLHAKKFGANDFAKHHPGGALGKRLFLTSGQIARQNDRPQVDLLSPINQVIDEITTKRLGTAVVIDQGTICGIITDGDIRRMLKNDQTFYHLKAKDIMSPDPTIIEDTMLAINALDLLEEKSINHLIVVNSKREYVGILHILDLIKEGIAR